MDYWFWKLEKVFVLKKCLCTSDPRITISRQAEMTSIGFSNYKHTPKKPKTNKQTNAHPANNLNPYATGSGLLALLWYALLYT